MAYGLKYYHNFYTAIKDIDVKYKIEIYLEGYAGATSEFEAGFTPITVERIDADMFEPIRKSTATVNIWNTTDNQYNEFLTAGYGDYYLKLIEDPDGAAIVKWVGFNQSEIVTEPYVQAPYNTAIKFTCGLSHLAYIPFDNSGTLYEGYKTLIEVLRLCTNKLPVALPYFESVNIYEDDMNSTTSDSMLAQCFVNTEVYRETNDKVEPNEVVAWMCYDVVSAILAPFKAHIYQWDNEWKVIRIQEYNASLSDFFYRRFNANVGAESTVTVASSGQEAQVYNITGVSKGNADEVVFLGDAAEQEMVAPLNKILLNYTETDKGASASFSSLIYNPSFGVETSQGLWQWAAVNFNDLTYQSIVFYNLKYWFTFNPTLLASSYSHDTATYITQTKSNLPFTAGDEVNLTLSVRSKLSVTNYDNSEWGDVTAQISTYDTYIPMEIKVGTYYLVGDYGGSTLQVNLTWSTTQGYTFITVRQYSAYNEGTTSSVPSSKNIMFDLPAMPATELGDAVIKVYPPYSNKDVFNASHTTQIDIEEYYITDFDLAYIQQGDTETIESLSLYTEIQEDINLYEEDLIHADGQLGLSLNSFRVDTGGAYPVLTNQWDRRGYTDNATIMELINSQLVELRGDFIRGLNADLVGKLNANKTIVYTLNFTTTYYLINSFVWDVRGQTWRLKLMQLEDLTLIEPPILGNPTYRVIPKVVTPEPEPAPFVDEYYTTKSKISLSNGGRLIGGDVNNSLLNYK